MAEPKRLIRCSTHEEVRAYMVCKHSLATGTYGVFVRATDEVPGEVLCSDKEHTLEELILACERCVEKRFGIAARPN